MSNENEEVPRLYSIDETHAIALIKHSDEQLEIIADLLSIETQEDPLDLKVLSLLCDSFSSNYHIWRILKTNLSYNVTMDEEKNIKVIAMSEQDLFMTENAIMSKAFSSVELLKLNYSLSLH